MSVIALRYAVLRFVESGEESYGCVAHCTIDELSPIFLRVRRWSLTNREKCWDRVQFFEN
jgi:hypothetical protein